MGMENYFLPVADASGSLVSGLSFLASGLWTLKSYFFQTLRRNWEGVVCFGSGA